MSPAQVPTVPRIVELARAELAADVHETSPNRGPIVDTYAPTCVRAQRFLDVRGLEWCARFVSELAWRAALDVERASATDARLWSPPDAFLGFPPFGLRCAVSELARDARACGAFRGLEVAELPQPGDVLLFGRAGENPLAGGRGHAAICESWSLEEGCAVISGNDAAAVRRRTWAFGATAPWPWVGWISLRAA